MGTYALWIFWLEPAAMGFHVRSQRQANHSTKKNI
jgi:hypothetical protein